MKFDKSSIIYDEKPKKIDYQKIILKYYKPNSLAYHVYQIHVTMVTAKALEIANRLKLKSYQKRFIEEATMLHDIGIIRVNYKQIGCLGELPYLHHLIEGRKMLEQEGLPIHARVCETHVGMGGITKEEIIKAKLILPAKDMIAETLEEKIISYADLFYSKKPSKLFTEKSFKEVKSKCRKMGERQEKLFTKLSKDFGYIS